MVNLRPIIPSFLILVWLSAEEVWADYADPLPLENAILAYSADERGWAYDEVVTAYNRKGKISGVRTTRVDPSLPWDQRPLLISNQQGIVRNIGDDRWYTAGHAFEHNVWRSFTM